MATLWFVDLILDHYFTILIEMLLKMFTLIRHDDDHRHHHNNHDDHFGTKVKKGRRAELRCVATGNPKPEIHWSREVSNQHADDRHDDNNDDNNDYDDDDDRMKITR